MVFKQVRTPELPEDDMLAATLAEVRRANMYGRLYTPPECVARWAALRALANAGLVANVPWSCTCWGGWYVCCDMLGGA